MNNDKNFEKIVELLFGLEGGYNNDSDDKGGATNYGVTQDTFDAWRKMNNLPLASVKNGLTKEEAKNIYYNMYWKESGADKYTDPRDWHYLIWRLHQVLQKQKECLNKVMKISMKCLIIVKNILMILLNITLVRENGMKDGRIGLKI